MRGSRRIRPGPASTLGTDVLDETLGSSSSGGRRPGAAGELVPALVILWCRSEPDRVGEVFLVADDAPEGRIIGRRSTPDPLRIPPLRQRPGGGAFTPELEEPALSRDQLRVRRAGAAVAVRNLGRRDALLRGAPLARGQEAVMEAGELLEIDRQLLLLCEMRPRVLPVGAPLPEDGHAFGAPCPDGLVGETPVLWSLRALVCRVAAQDREHVLIHGPSGTGKERVARAIHRRSPRGRRPLVSRSAASIPETLVDAELFGNMEGFPGPGMRARPGLVGEADASSLFLDEIGEVSHELQARLLRVMDAGEYTPLGAARPRRADVRFIGATNRDPATLKHDFQARFPLRVATPGLAAMQADIPLIARALLRELAPTDPGGTERFAPRAEDGVPRASIRLVEALVLHRYTTHVREVRQLLHASLIESPGPWVEPCEALRQAAERVRAAPTLPQEAEVFSPEELRRLQLQRRHGFDATRCGDDPEYPTNRQNAALTLNLLVCRALRACGMGVEGAVALLIGGARSADPTADRLRRRVRSFLDHQREAPAPVGEEIPADLRRYGAQAAEVLEVRRAVHDGRVR